jgi:hypothetical protein
LNDLECSGTCSEQDLNDLRADLLADKEIAKRESELAKRVQAQQTRREVLNDCMRQVEFARNNPERFEEARLRALQDAKSESLHGDEAAEYVRQHLAELFAELGEQEEPE